MAEQARSLRFDAGTYCSFSKPAAAIPRLPRRCVPEALEQIEHLAQRGAVFSSDGRRLVTPTCAGNGFAWRHTDATNASRTESVRLADGVMLFASAMHLDEAAISWARFGAGYVSIALLLDGSYTNVAANRREVRWVGPHAMINVAAKDFSLARLYSPGVTSSSVLILAESIRHLEAFGIPAAILPAPIRSLTPTGAPSAAFVRVEPNPMAIATGRNILHCEYENERRHVYLTAAAKELICHLSVSRLTGTHILEAQPMPSGSLTAALARGLILSNLSRPLSIRTLAARLNVSTRKLMRDFRHVYGMTIQDFARTARLDDANRLLSETTRPITEIAFEAGYQSPSSFSVAFRQQYGMSPREARRRNASAHPGAGVAHEGSDQV